MPAAPEGDACHPGGRSRPSSDHRLQDYLGLMSSQLLTGPRAHVQLVPPIGSGLCASKLQDLCCWLGCSSEGVSSQVIEEAEPTQPQPHPTPPPLSSDRFVLQLPAARRRQVQEPGWGVASGREALGTFVTLLAVGSPWSAEIAHVWWVGVTSFLLIGCDSSCPHPLEQHSPS